MGFHPSTIREICSPVSRSRTFTTLRRSHPGYRISSERLPIFGNIFWRNSASSHSVASSGPRGSVERQKHQCPRSMPEPMAERLSRRHAAESIRISSNLSGATSGIDQRVFRCYGEGTLRLTPRATPVSSLARQRRGLGCRESHATDPSPLTRRAAGLVAHSGAVSGSERARSGFPFCLTSEARVSRNGPGQ